MENSSERFGSSPPEATSSSLDPLLGKLASAGDQEMAPGWEKREAELKEIRREQFGVFEPGEEEQVFESQLSSLLTRALTISFALSIPAALLNPAWFFIIVSALVAPGYGFLIVWGGSKTEGLADSERLRRAGLAALSCLALTIISSLLIHTVFVALMGG